LLALFKSLCLHSFNQLSCTLSVTCLVAICFVFLPICQCIVVVRRIRELNEKNTKKFIDERKRQCHIQEEQIKTLNKLHQQQLDRLQQETKAVSIQQQAM